MEQYKIATSFDISNCIDSQRNLVNIVDTDFTDVEAIIISLKDIQQSGLDTIKQKSFGQPIFALIEHNQFIPPKTLACLTGVIDLNKHNTQLYAKQLETAAQKYKQSLLSPLLVN